MGDGGGRSPPQNFPFRPSFSEELTWLASSPLLSGSYKVMTMIPSFMRKLPGVPENDLSGTVVDASDSTRFHVGDAVFGLIPVPDGPKSGRGALCQYVVIKVSSRRALDRSPRSKEDTTDGLALTLRRVLQDKHLVLKPDALSFEEAAGIPVAGGTAHEALTTKGNLKAGERVFINGSSPLASYQSNVSI